MLESLESIPFTIGLLPRSSTMPSSNFMWTNIRSDLSLESWTNWYSHHPDNAIHLWWECRSPFDISFLSHRHIFLVTMKIYCYGSSIRKHSGLLLKVIWWMNASKRNNCLMWSYPLWFIHSIFNVYIKTPYRWIHLNSRSIHSMKWYKFHYNLLWIIYRVQHMMYLRRIMWNTNLFVSTHDYDV